MRSSEANRLSLMSYNIHHCEGLDKRLDPARIAEVIRQADPDAAVLNEVDSGWERSGNTDQPAELAKLLGWNVVFGPALTSPGFYGNAVLSRYPLEKIAVIQLPYGNENRIALVVRVDAPRPFYVMATHLANGKNAGPDRVRGMRDLTDAVLRNDWKPLLFAGDLNAAPDSEPVELLRQNGFLVADDVLPEAKSYPADAPRILLDYIAFYPVDAACRTVFTVCSESLASDHRPVKAEFELSK
ncbi:MAG: endonuclease/exonuclease/phosphatase family protein [Lentisphaeria bacterium]|nr:endonuclease/exonuclease/phosphatase family protein [Lentisphaeria bacterium]